MSLVFHEEDKIDFNSLQQGDILQRKSELLKAIGQAHSYYAEASDYEFFIVLTQSCDLVRRGKKPPNARYVTIAAVRPLNVVIDRLLPKQSLSIDGFPVPLYAKQSEPFVRNALERLLHNTADGLFFLKNGSHTAMAGHYCAFLALSVALRIEHYDACLGAKIAQMRDVFQAKLGWLTGNLYSRVGTPDEEGDPASIRDAFLNEVLYERTFWLTPEQYRELRTKTKGNKPSGVSEAREVINTLRTDAETLAEQIVNNLAADILKNDDVKTKLKNRILSDTLVSRLIGP